MKVLIVTGGIGSGKSLVCRMLTESHCIPVYEADRRVKALYSEIPSMLDDIEKTLEVSVRDDDGTFVPQRLADVIFADHVALKKLEDIVFPRLKEDFARWADEHGKDVVAFESATVLEKTYFDGFGDMNVLVNAPFDLRLSRAVERDGDRKRVKSRMTLQNLMNRLSEGFVDERIDFVIDNSGTLDELKSRIHDFVSYIGHNKNVTSAQQRC